MRFFADSYFWIGYLDEHDPAHGAIMAFLENEPQAEVITSEDCLVEVLNHFSRASPAMRLRAAAFVEGMITGTRPLVVKRDAAQLRRAVQFYAARPDKGYSLVDCLSMVTMRELKLRRVLTRDRHFAQEGFDCVL